MYSTIKLFARTRFKNKDVGGGGADDIVPRGGYTCG